MNTKEEKFEEQDHPLKNTDHAFVQVGKDGAPVFPKDSADDKSKEQDSDKSSTTIEHQ